MSAVDKMLIKEIRSIDPENKNVITVFRPSPSSSAPTAPAKPRSLSA